jgi:hypothetical protein
MKSLTKQAEGYREVLVLPVVTQQSVPIIIN